MAASHSPIFIALIGSLFDGEFHRVERALDTILARRGALGTSLSSHEQIVAAIRDRRPAEAADAMSGHLRRIQEELYAYGQLPHIAS